MLECPYSCYLELKKTKLVKNWVGVFNSCKGHSSSQAKELYSDKHNNWLPGISIPVSSDRVGNKSTNSTSALDTMPDLVVSAEPCSLGSIKPGT